MYQLQNTNRNFNVFHFFKINIGKADKLMGIIKTVPQGYYAEPIQGRPEILATLKHAQKFLKNPFRYSINH